MALREEFERDGNWLFRWRSFLPLLMVGLFLASSPGIDHSGHSANYHRLWAILSLAICLLGLAVRAHAIGHAANSTSGRNTTQQVADCVNTTGIYSLVRHPLYLGNFLIWLGLAVFPHTWWLTLICILIFWLYYERIMFAEEEFLRNKFGDIYVRWAAITPAFVPKMTGYVTPAEPFSLKTVLKKETDGFYAFIVILAALEVASNLAAKHRFEVDAFMVGVFAVGTLIWATLKLLKKKTNVLNRRQ